MTVVLIDEGPESAESGDSPGVCVRPICWHARGGGMSRRKSLWWYIVSKVSILQDLFCTLRCVSDLLRAVNQTGKEKWS